MTATALEKTDVVTSVDDEQIDDDDDAARGKEEQKHRFVVMRAKGYSYARIGRQLRVSKGTLTAWNAEMEAEIAKARAVELEALQEEFSLLKEGRIRLIGEQLKAIQAEIGRRDLSKVNTDKLLELQLRY
ncbi:MAG: transposase, partial [Phycisphaerae bacterium]|nr:transposase [Phycisphaerae bacterium]